MNNFPDVALDELSFAESLEFDADDERLRPDFLTLPERSSKPRSVGLTHVLDKGMSVAGLGGLLDIAGEHIDIVKLGWGTSYVSRGVAAKVRACRGAGVRVCTGGTLLEIAAAQGRVGEFSLWAARCGFDTVEVSTGTVDLGRERKRELITRLAREFTVLAEVGSKDRFAAVLPDAWADEAEDDLAAGAALIVAEGRESGTVGVYNDDGSVNSGVVEALAERIGVDRVIFEAPSRPQQTWFVRRLGPDVNLGNVAADDVIGTETLRRGLRADTAWTAVAAWMPSATAEALYRR